MTTKQLMCAALAYAVLGVLLMAAGFASSSTDLVFSQSALFFAASGFWIVTTVLLGVAAVRLRRRGRGEATTS